MIAALKRLASAVRFRPWPPHSKALTHLPKRSFIPLHSKTFGPLRFAFAGMRHVWRGLLGAGSTFRPALSISAETSNPRNHCRHRNHRHHHASTVQSRRRTPTAPLRWLRTLTTGPPALRRLTAACSGPGALVCAAGLGSSSNRQESLWHSRDRGVHWIFQSGPNHGSVGFTKPKAGSPHFGFSLSDRSCQKLR